MVTDAESWDTQALGVVQNAVISTEQIKLVPGFIDLYCLGVAMFHGSLLREIGLCIA